MFGPVTLNSVFMKLSSYKCNDNSGFAHASLVAFPHNQMLCVCNIGDLDPKLRLKGIKYLHTL